MYIRTYIRIRTRTIGAIISDENYRSNANRVGNDILFDQHWVLKIHMLLVSIQRYKPFIFIEAFKVQTFKPLKRLKPSNKKEIAVSFL